VSGIRLKRTVEVYLLLNPIVVLLDFISFLGGIAGVDAGLAALAVSLVFSLVVVAVAWFSYRPVLSIGLVGSAVAVLALVRTTRKRTR